MFMGDFCMLKYNINTCHFWTWLKRIDVNRTLKQPSLKRRWLSLQNCFLFYKNFDLAKTKNRNFKTTHKTLHLLCIWDFLVLFFNHCIACAFWRLHNEGFTSFLKEYKLSQQSFLVLLSLWVWSALGMVLGWMTSRGPFQHHYSDMMHWMWVFSR